MGCSVPGCANRAEKRGWCGAHYRRWRVVGDVRAHVPLRARLDLPKAFWSKVSKGPACWLWTGAVLNSGYGEINHRRQVRLVHRVAYELEVGPIPDGYQIDHLCRVRLCVNPTHLEAVTQAENLRRQNEARRSA